MKKDMKETLERETKEIKRVNLRDYFSTSPINKSFKTVFTEGLPEFQTSMPIDKKEEISTKTPVKEDSMQLPLFLQKRSTIDTEFNVFDILQQDFMEVSAPKTNDENGPSNYVFNMCDLRFTYTELQISSLNSYSWLINELQSLKDNYDPYLRNMKYFLNYFYFNSAVNNHDSTIFDVLSDCHYHFIRDSKREFKIISESFELYGFHDERILESLIESSKIEKIKRFTAYMILKVKNKSGLFLTKVNSEKVNMTKLKVSDVLEDEDEYLIVAKEISIIFQIMIDFFMNGNYKFECISNFLFANSINRKNDIEFMNCNQEAIVINNESILNDNMVKGMIKRYR